MCRLNDAPVVFLGIFNVSTHQRQACTFQKKDKIKAAVLEQANSTNGNKKMSPDQFKQWLTDEYYRNMAMSFATMRKKRSILEQTAGAAAPPSGDEGEAFEKLRLMEESLLQDALQDIIHVGSTTGSGLSVCGIGSRFSVRNRFIQSSIVGCSQEGSESHATKKKPQFVGKLDVAQDIENLKRVLQSLLADTQRLKAINEAEIMASLRNAAKDVDSAREEQELPTQCPELRVLTNGCTALRGMFPPEPVQGQFLASCNWHEVCYSCVSGNCTVCRCFLSPSILRINPACQRIPYSHCRALNTGFQPNSAINHSC